MNTALWIMQGLLGFAFLAAGGMKLAVPRGKLKEKMPWAEDFSDGQVKLIGLAELLGGIGLVVPWATGILPVLTPIAALGLCLVMVGAARTHMQRKEPPIPAIPLAALALFIALGRFGIF